MTIMSSAQILGSSGLGNLRLWEVESITGKVVNWDFTDQEKSERRAEKRYFEKWVYSGQTYRCPHWKADAATSAPVTVQTYDSPLLHNCYPRNLSYSSSLEQTLDSLVTAESTAMLPFQIWLHWGRICQFSCYATNNYKCLRWFDVNHISLSAFRKEFTRKFERRNNSWNLFEQIEP